MKALLKTNSEINVLRVRVRMRIRMRITIRMMIRVRGASNIRHQSLVLADAIRTHEKLMYSFIFRGGGGEFSV